MGAGQLDVGGGAASAGLYNAVDRGITIKLVADKATNVKGAPFQVFLSADDERPKKLAEEGLAVSETRFTYAIGKLVLWSRDPKGVTGEETLRANAFSKLSIANPAAAPYGVAAIEVLKALKIHDAAQPKIVMGATIAQAFQFIDTGNAEIGFVALSQVLVDGRMDGRIGGRIREGSAWIVPPSLHDPIRQDAVLLSRGQGNPAATALLAYLRGDKARAVIRAHGYSLGAGVGS
jgi:molybdate transport system substrate-binding protein